MGQAGGNIVEIEHQRMFLDVSARSAELEVVVETIDHAHVERVIAALADVGLVARVGSVDVRALVDLDLDLEPTA